VRAYAGTGELVNIDDDHVPATTGYGTDDLHVSLDAPYAHRPTGDGGADGDLKDKLKTMSKSTKQKFALMARKFYRKNKGAKG
jgi:hypothetical protein